MRAFTLSAYCCLLLVSATLFTDTAQAQRQKAAAKKATTEAPLYDDYAEYDQAADDQGDKSAEGNKAADAKSTTAAPEDDDATGAHALFKNRQRLKSRPSPHPAVKPKPTLPSFIKHPANIEDLGHDRPSHQKPTEAPLPRPKGTTSKPSRFSGANRKKLTPAPTKEDDYEYEDESVDKTPALAAGRKPLKPRRL